VSVKITNWNPIAGKHTLRAFFSVELSSGLVIHRCTLHERDAQRWISVPGLKDGGTFKSFVEFTSRQVADNFRRQVLRAIEEQHLA